MQCRACSTLVLIATLLFGAIDNGWADSFPPEMNIIMTVAAKRACDAAIPNFATETDESYKAWVKRHAEQIEQTKKKFGELKLQDAIEQLSSYLNEEGTKSDLTDYCKELSDWVKSPLD
jgi:hypothetical protein